MCDGEEEHKKLSAFHIPIKERKLLKEYINFNIDMRNYLLNKGERKESKTKEQIIMEVKDFDSLE